MPAWVEWLLEARYQPYSTEKLKKLVLVVKPPFDREGNDLATGRLTKWAVGLGLFALSVAVWNQRQQQVQALASRWLK